MNVEKKSLIHKPISLICKTGQTTKNKKKKTVAGKKRY